MNKLIASSHSALGTLVAAALAGTMLLGVSSTPAHALSGSVDLKCNESRYFAPQGLGYQDVVSNPTSSNPSIAVASGITGDTRAKGRVRPGGTDGGITVTAGSQEGSTTITYDIKSFAGEVQTIYLDVEVSCPPPEKVVTGNGGVVPGIPAPGPGVPVFPPAGPGGLPPSKPGFTISFNQIPTHRATSCSSCQPIANALNEVIDRLSAEMIVVKGHLEGPASAAVDYAAFRELVAELNDCERKCLPVTTPVSEPDPVPPLIEVLRPRTDDDDHHHFERHDDDHHYGQHEEEHKTTKLEDQPKTVPFESTPKTTPQTTTKTTPVTPTNNKREEGVLEGLKQHTRTDVPPAPRTTTLTDKPVNTETHTVSKIEPRTDTKVTKLEPETVHTHTVAPTTTHQAIHTPELSHITSAPMNHVTTMNHMAPTMSHMAPMNLGRTSMVNAFHPTMGGLGGLGGMRMGGLGMRSRDTAPTPAQEQTVQD